MLSRAVEVVLKFRPKAIAIAISLIAVRSSLGQVTSRPIVDVRFDTPYQQIMYSKGDNWAPTWGRDDVLYTGSDDGENFGGMALNAVAFGKLEGPDPYHLKATTISSMPEYREGSLFHRIDDYSFHGVAYKLGTCPGASVDSPKSVCLNTASGSTRLFAAEQFGSPSFVTISSDIAKAEFGESLNDYVFAAARTRNLDGEDEYVLGRVPTAKLSRANATDWNFLKQDYSWSGNLSAATTIVNAQSTDANGATWKTTSTYSVDGTLYMFVARIDDFMRTGEPKGRLIFRDSSVIKSTDGGRTWARSAKENHDSPMFPGPQFGTPHFVWYGKDGHSTVDNGDRYVYALSNDGFWESGDDYIVGRVLRSRLADLSAKDWTFFRAGDGMKDESWTQELTKATPVLSDAEQAGMTGATYIEGLGRYVLVTWYYPSHGVRDVEKNEDTYTVLEFFDAPHPWGPWTRFKTFKTEGLGWYTPIIGQRFQSKDGSSTVHAFLYTTALDWKTAEGKRIKPLYRLNYLPITLSTAPIEHNDPAFTGAR